MNISLVIKNGTTGKSCWIKDYSFTCTAEPSGTLTLTITGSHYDHDYGYVTISTLIPLQVTLLNAWDSRRPDIQRV